MDDPETRFTALYDRHHRRVLAYLLTHAEQGAAEDIASETFLVAWRRLDDIPKAELPWLLGVARNMIHKAHDGGRRRRALAERVAALTSPGDLAAWDVAEHVVERDAALAAVGALPERDLEVLALVIWHGLEPREAAKVLGCSSAALFVRLHRARKVTDPLGRSGIAVAVRDEGTVVTKSGSRFESRLIVDPGTGRLLAYQVAIGKGSQVKPSLTVAYQSMGWTGKLGGRP